MSTTPQKPQQTRTPGDHDTSAADTHADRIAASGAPPVKATAPLAGNVDQQIAAQQAQIATILEQNAALAAANAALMAQFRAVATPAPVDEKLPTVAEAIAMRPDAPVKTVDGLFVPRVTSSNPEVQSTAALITALQQSGTLTMQGAATAKSRAVPGEDDLSDEEMRQAAAAFRASKHSADAARAAA